MTGDVESDALLMQRVAAGDNRACRDLAAAHLARLVALAGRMLGERAAAEDVAQEAFFRLWRQAGRWQAKARIGTWLYRVAHNLCIDRLRAQGKLSDREVPDRPDPAPGPFAARHQSQVAARVEAALAGLPERQRTALALVHFEEVGNSEAAEIMGVSVEALESLLARGRRRLRQDLAGERDELRGEA